MTTNSRGKEGFFRAKKGFLRGGYITNCPNFIGSEFFAFRKVDLAVVSEKAFLFQTFISISSLLDSSIVRRYILPSVMLQLLLFQGDHDWHLKERKNSSELDRFVLKFYHFLKSHYHPILLTLTLPRSKCLQHTRSRSLWKILIFFFFFCMMSARESWFVRNFESYLHRNVKCISICYKYIT